MSRILSLLGWIAVATVAGCATAPGTDDGGAARSSRGTDCFFARTLRDWRPLDEENLILFASGRRPYHVELVRPIFGLTFDFMIGVYDRDGQICPFGGDAIIVDGAIPDRVTIRSITALDEAELDAIYVQFGIESPAVVEVTEVDPDEVESDSAAAED